MSDVGKVLIVGGGIAGLTLAAASVGMVSVPRSSSGALSGILRAPVCRFSRTGCVCSDSWAWTPQ